MLYLLQEIGQRKFSIHTCISTGRCALNAAGLQNWLEVYRYKFILTCELIPLMCSLHVCTSTSLAVFELKQQVMPTTTIITYYRGILSKYVHTWLSQYCTYMIVDL